MTDVTQLAGLAFCGIVVWGGLKLVSIELDAQRQRRRAELKVDTSHEAMQELLEELLRKQQAGRLAEQVPVPVPSWARVLELELPTTHQDVTKAYHRLSRVHHPDVSGADGDMQRRLNDAREEALHYLSK